MFSFFRRSTFHLTYIETFVFAFHNICVCISLHLCFNFWTYVNICHINSHHMSLHLALLARHLWLDIWCRLDKCVFIGPYFFVTHKICATTNANTCIQKCIDKCTHTQHQMHKIVFCDNKILIYVITLNKTLFSQGNDFMHLLMHLFTDILTYAITFIAYTLTFVPTFTVCASTFANIYVEHWRTNKNKCHNKCKEIPQQCKQM